MLFFEREISWNISTKRDPFQCFAETFGFVEKWREGGGGRNESGKVSREERKRERERNLQRANDESSNIFNLYVYIYIYIFICEKNIY